MPLIGSLARAVYGLTLLRAGYAPRLLLAGGRAKPDSGLEALAMRKLLEGIGASSKLLETEELSTRTYTNAVESSRILQPQGATHILLVTHSNHMLRAKLAFEKAGFIVNPAPIPWDRLPERATIRRIPRRPLRIRWACPLLVERMAVGIKRSALISSATAETLGAEMALQAWRNAAVSWRLWCPARLLRGGHRRSYGPVSV